MGKVVLGGFLLVAGLFLSFIPPFIWGFPLFAAGLAMGAAGLFGTSVKAAKTVVSVSKELSQTRGKQTDPEPAYASPAFSLPPKRTPSEPTQSSNADAVRWDTLLQYDDELRKANERLMSYGKRYAETLANDYLAINDKSYLKAMVEKIESNAIADRLRRGEIIDKGTFWGVDW